MSDTNSATTPNSKDTVQFPTKYDHMEKSTVVLSGREVKSCVTQDNGEIKWTCPCLESMATGPCNIQFRNAFTCYHNATVLLSSADCTALFQELEDCMQSNPKAFLKHVQGLKKPPPEKDCEFKG